MPSIPRGSMSTAGRSTRKLSAALATLRAVLELLEQVYRNRAFGRIARRLLTAMTPLDC
jgi:hypothetical protein